LFERYPLTEAAKLIRNDRAGTADVPACPRPANPITFQPLDKRELVLWDEGRRTPAVPARLFLINFAASVSG